MSEWIQERGEKREESVEDLVNELVIYEVEDSDDDQQNTVEPPSDAEDILNKPDFVSDEELLIAEIGF